MELLLVLGWFFAALLYHGVYSVTVKTDVGNIVGYEETFGDEKLQKFHGIPYAEAPIGNLRFKAPVIKAPFKEPYHADKFGFCCPQLREWLEKLLFSQETQNLEMNEDCLSLNVYVPNGGEARKAVMVWIHGGGFTMGAGMQYDGSKMAAKGDVIVVTINYRLGLLGFFTTGDDNAPGNSGLLDQHLALKWVNKNIGAFGGDKDRVTIFGESAGAGSVTWQMLAPSNDGLFQRVIAESGTALAPWALPDPKIAMQYTDTLAEKLGCSNSDSSQVVSCMQGLPTDDLACTMSGYPHSDIGGSTPAGPRADGVFLPHSPKSRLPNERMEDQVFFRSLDFMIGANRYEGSPFVAFMLEPMYKAQTNISLFDDGVPKDWFRLFAKAWSVENDGVVEAFWWLYAAKDPMSAHELLEFIGDTMFYDGTNKFLKRHAPKAVENGGSTFMYSFLPMPSKLVGSLGYVMSREPWIDGAIHADELGFLFGGATEENKAKLEAGELDLSDAMIVYWTNFAKTGDPNQPTPVPHQWPKYEVGEEEYIEFDIKDKQLDLRIGAFYRNRYLSFWQNVLPLIEGPCMKEATSQTVKSSAKTEL